MRNCLLWAAGVVFLGGCCLRQGLVVDTPQEAVHELQLVLMVEDVSEELGAPADDTYFGIGASVRPKAAPQAFEAPDRRRSGPTMGVVADPKYQEVYFTAQLKHEACFLCVGRSSGAVGFVLLEPDELRVLRPVKGGIMMRVTIGEWHPVDRWGRMDVLCVWGVGRDILATGGTNVLFRIGSPVVLRNESQPEERGGFESPVRIWRGPD